MGKQGLGAGRRQTKPKRLTRYEHSDASDPRTPETGHTSDIREEEIVELPMDGWTNGLELDEAGLLYFYWKKYRFPWRKEAYMEKEK